MYYAESDVINNRITTRNGQPSSRPDVPSASAGTDEGWRQAVAAYLAQKDCKESSRRAYAKALSQYFHWVSATGRTLSAMTTADVLIWKRDLLETGHSSRTVSLYMLSLKGFYAWVSACTGCDDITRQVKSSVRDGGHKKFIKQHLTDEQGAALLDHFRERSLRDFAMINLMLRTGLRTIEVSRANVGDIGVRGNRRVLFVQGKGQDDRTQYVVLSDMAYRPIEEYLATRPGVLSGAPLFCCSEGRRNGGRRMSTRTIQKVGKDGLRAIGLDSREYSTHSLRHTTGVQIMQHGGTQFDVQDVLRHASPETSLIYLESIKEETRIKRAPETFLDTAFLSKNII